MQGRVPDGRPDQFSSAVIKRVATAITLRLTEYPDMKDSGEEVERDIIKAIDRAMSTDAFKICKELDFYGWDCDAELVSAIDSVVFFAQSKAVKEETIQWVIDNNYTPRFKVGDFVAFKQWNDLEVGEITKVDAERMRYTIFCEHLGHVPDGKGPGTHGFIINDERIVDYANKPQ